MAHYELPHQDLRCLQIRLFSSLVHILIESTSDVAVNTCGRFLQLIHIQSRWVVYPSDLALHCAEDK